MTTCYKQTLNLEYSDIEIQNMSKWIKFLQSYLLFVKQISRENLLIFRHIFFISLYHCVWPIPWQHLTEMNQYILTLEGVVEDYRIKDLKFSERQNENRTIQSMVLVLKSISHQQKFFETLFWLNKMVAKSASRFSKNRPLGRFFPVVAKSVHGRIVCFSVPSPCDSPRGAKPVRLLKDRPLPAISWWKYGIVSVLLSALVERFFVPRMRKFLQLFCLHSWHARMSISSIVFHTMPGYKRSLYNVVIFLQI